MENDDDDCDIVQQGVWERRRVEYCEDEKKTTFPSTLLFLSNGGERKKLRNYTSLSLVSTPHSSVQLTSRMKGEIVQMCIERM